MSCKACAAKDSELTFLREMVTRLTTEKPKEIYPPQKAYISSADGEVEYLEEDATNDAEVGIR